MNETELIHRAQSAEARIETAREAGEQLKAKLRSLTETFGIKTGFSGNMSIDYDMLVENLGAEQALILRGIIDKHYAISGEPGDKPKIRMPAAAASA